MAKLKLSKSSVIVPINQRVKKAWADLSEQQKQEATKQLIHAGWKNAKDYPRITFTVNPDGSIYGWNDPKFFI